MISKILHKLSKKASRKNLEKKILESFKKIDNEAKVLIIGSGGELQKLITNHYKNNYSIDIDKKREPNQVIDLCDQNFSKEIRFKPNIVCCFEVLEHTINPQAAVANIYKILEKDDYCLASVPFNFHIHDEPNDYYRFTLHGLEMLFKNFSEVSITSRNGWLESVFINFIRLEKEKNILSKIVGKIFIILYFILLPLILILQKIITSKKLTTGYYVEARK